MQKWLDNSINPIWRIYKGKIVVKIWDPCDVTKRAFYTYCKAESPLGGKSRATRLFPLFCKLWSPFSTRRLFSREATFSFVGIAFADVISDADKGKSRFARKKSPSGKQASCGTLDFWPPAWAAGCSYEKTGYKYFNNFAGKQAHCKHKCRFKIPGWRIFVWWYSKFCCSPTWNC